MARGARERAAGASTAGDEMSQERFIAAFWAKVSKGASDECWPWMGCKGRSGHGLTSLGYGVSISAHRKAWVLTNGRIQGDLCVLHRCDNAACCNPAHLYLGTRADNMADRFGKVPAGERGPGRISVLSAEQLAELTRLRHSGVSLKECASRFGVHIATICRHVTVRRFAKLRKMRADRLSLHSRKDI